MHVNTFSLCLPLRIHVHLKNLVLLQIFLVKCANKMKDQIQLFTKIHNMKRFNKLTQAFWGTGFWIAQCIFWGLVDCGKWTSFWSNGLSTKRAKYILLFCINVLTESVPRHRYDEKQSQFLKAECSCLNSALLLLDQLPCKGSREGLRGVVVDILDCDFVVNEFEPQSCYYVFFRTNTFRNSMNSLVLSIIG